MRPHVWTRRPLVPPQADRNMQLFTLRSLSAAHRAEVAPAGSTNDGREQQTRGEDAAQAYVPGRPDGVFCPDSAEAQGLGDEAGGRYEIARAKLGVRGRGARGGRGGAGS